APSALVTLQYFPLGIPFSSVEGWTSWFATWEMGTFYAGFAILFFGLAYIKIHLPTRSSNSFGLIAGVLYILVGVFGVLIGLGTGFSAFPLFSDNTLIPWMYVGLLFPSFFGLVLHESPVK
ncbi:MAG: hypothetical protein ACXABC_15110, partial [Candidatus Thorarchaeota archaeon]